MPGRAGHFQEAFRIQVEYFQAQLKGAASDAAQIGAKMAGSFNTSIREPNIVWSIATCGNHDQHLPGAAGVLVGFIGLSWINAAVPVPLAQDMRSSYSGPKAFAAVAEAI